MGKVSPNFTAFCVSQALKSYNWWVEMRNGDCEKCPLLDSNFARIGVA